MQQGWGPGNEKGWGCAFLSFQYLLPFASPGAEPPRLPAPNLQAEASTKSSRELCLRKRVLAAASFRLDSHGP